MIINYNNHFHLLNERNELCIFVAHNNRTSVCLRAIRFNYVEYVCNECWYMRTLMDKLVSVISLCRLGFPSPLRHIWQDGSYTTRRWWGQVSSRQAYGCTIHGKREKIPAPTWTQTHIYLQWIVVLVAANNFISLIKINVDLRKLNFPFIIYLLHVKWRHSLCTIRPQSEPRFTNSIRLGDYTLKLTHLRYYRVDAVPAALIREIIEAVLFHFLWGRSSVR